MTTQQQRIEVPSRKKLEATLKQEGAKKRRGQRHPAAGALDLMPLADVAKAVSPADSAEAPQALKPQLVTPEVIKQRLIIAREVQIAKAREVADKPVRPSFQATKDRQRLRDVLGAVDRLRNLDGDSEGLKIPVVKSRASGAVYPVMEVMQKGERFQARTVPGVKVVNGQMVFDKTVTGTVVGFDGGEPVVGFLVVGRC